MQSTSHRDAFWTEVLLLRERKKRLIELRGWHAGVCTPTEGQGQRAPFLFKALLVIFRAVCRQLMSRRELHHKFFQSLSSPQVEKNETSKICCTHGLSDVVRDGMKRDRE